MGNTMDARRYWVDWYPVQERILDGFDKGEKREEGEEEGICIVDVGGGKGHDLMQFEERFPGHRLVCRIWML